MSAEDERVVDLSRGKFFVSPLVVVRLLWTLAGLAFAGVILGIKVALFAHDAVVSMNLRLDRMDGRTSDRWTLSMQRKYTDDLARHNPMIQAPDPDEISTKLQIR